MDVESSQGSESMFKGHRAREVPWNKWVQRKSGVSDRKWRTSWSGLSAWGTLNSQILSLRDNIVGIQRFEVSYAQDIIFSFSHPHYKWTTLVFFALWDSSEGRSRRAICRALIFRKASNLTFLIISKWSYTYSHRDILIRY